MAKRVKKGRRARGCLGCRGAQANKKETRRKTESRAKVYGSNKCNGKFAFAGHAAVRTSHEEKGAQGEEK